MAWTIDTNFGSTLISSTAFSPFDTSGGNKVLGFGAGVAYRDDIAVDDMQLECDMVVKNQIAITGFTYKPAAYLIGRRQTADGSLYAVGYTQSFSGLSGRRGTMIVYKYNGTSDTFTELSFGLILSTDIDTPVELQLLTFRMSVNGSSIQGSLLDKATGKLLLQVAAVDSEFSLAGNPGIGGTLVDVGNNNTVAQIFADNLQIDSI